MKTISDVEVMFRGSRRVFAMETFDAIQTGFDHRGNDIIDAIQPGMCQNGHTAGVVNEVDGLGSRHLEFRHPRRAVFLEEPFKGFVEAAAMASAHQSTSD